jgi:hypothetical protein
MRGDQELKEKEVKSGRELTDGISSAFVSMKEKVQSMNKQEFELFHREQALQILDSAAGKIFDEVADRVLAEDVEIADSEGLEGGTDNLLVAKEKIGGRDGAEVQQEGQQMDGGMENGDVGAADGTVQGALGASSSEVKAAAAIKEALHGNTRSSPRFVGSNEEHTLARAERRAAEKKLGAFWR